MSKVPLSNGFDIEPGVPQIIWIASLNIRPTLNIKILKTSCAFDEA